MNANVSIALIGRLLLGGMFLLAGIGKFGGLAGTAGYIASVGLPMPGVLAFLTATLEVVAGAALIAGFQARWAALALAVFTVAATVLFHNYWAFPADQQFVQGLMFKKNLAIVGGLLLIYVLGAGPASVDTRRRLVAA
jgi:putative oxidoreductase